MMKCDRHESLLMHYFDGDLRGHEREELDQHLNSCSNCRLLLSQLSGILDTLENARTPEPEPHLERLVMDRIMLLPTQPDINEQYKSAKLVYALSAGIIALLLWITSLTIQDWGLIDIVLAGRNYLDVISVFMVDLQIVYQIIAGLFPSEIFSLFLGIQFIIVAAILMLALVTMKTVFGGPTGEHLDVS